MGDVVVATEPTSDEPIYLKRGPFGPYLQLGEAGEAGAKPKRVSLPPGVAPHDVNAELALKLIELPMKLGEHPDDAKPVEVGIGRYGPYVKHGSVYASIPKAEFLLDVGLERALELLSQKKRRGTAPIKELGADPRTGDPIELYEGRFGPYVKRGSVNASLPRDLSVDDLSLEQASDLLDAREAAGGGTRGGRGAKAASTKAKAGTKAKAPTKAKKATKAKARTKPARPTGPKATNEQLAALLGELEPDDAAVVRLTLGAGAPAISVEAAAAQLGIDAADAAARNKRGLFKLRMSYGRQRKQAGEG
ncbi:MAG TPA: topoisomerase C-terminal repeat-containing protein [Trueperaceae bacterium]|nr:topoisomerase C-terminal repeat-containing protein [Trueperaceae bacterium]